MSSTSISLAAEMPQVTEHSYQESKRKLSMLAQLTALDVVQSVRRHLRAAAVHLAISDPVTRLIGADVTESILAVRVGEVALSDEYKACQTLNERSVLLEGLLTVHLLNWLMQRDETGEAQRLARAMLAP